MKQAPVETKFTTWLTAEMAARGLNQSQLALYAGLRPSSVNSWFNRGAVPSYDTCVRIGRALRVDAYHVLHAAGYDYDVDEPETEELPDWASLIPSLAPDDIAYLGRLVRLLARDRVPEEAATTVPLPQRVIGERPPVGKSSPAE